MSVAKNPKDSPQMLLFWLRCHTPKLKTVAENLSEHAGRRVWRQQLTRWTAGGGISMRNHQILKDYVEKLKGRSHAN